MKPEARKQFRVKQDLEERSSLDERWSSINMRLKEQSSSYKQPDQPFVKENLIRDFNDLYFKIYDKVKAVEL